MFMQGHMDRPIMRVRSIDPHRRIASVDLPPVSTFIPCLYLVSLARFANVHAGHRLMNDFCLMESVHTEWWQKLKVIFPVHDVPTLPGAYHSLSQSRFALPVVRPCASSSSSSIGIASMEKGLLTKLALNIPLIAIIPNQTC